ncbi:hypothetical protein FGG08_003643 [Glutinoglossum americanum]|uniref:Uncharacterized protein n=1 Tax=Glutinoglossum americanum TaxID=1670608 RepID=A0A9P8IAP2_9PEZI|nr:hypothetical protein FGG08_003643 [Glutinoglossum americanum]
MSQLRLRDGGQVSNGYSFPNPGDQLTADQKQHQQPYPNSLSTTYDLGAQRSSSQQVQSTSNVRHAQRKPDPSAQQSAGGTHNSPNPSPTAIAGFDRGQSHSFPRPPGNTLSSRTIIYESQAGRGQPSSPREKLDKLLATEGYHYSSQPPKVLTEAKYIESGASLEESAYAQPKFQPAELNSTRPAQTGGVSSQPSSTMPSQQADPRPIPRNSSIDSAVSSISSQTSVSHKTDPAPASPAEIANLISTAGSAEIVIQYLLKEKQSSAAQNTQLWRLVDKQRAMILGLNKDLERALKDKERYRKKLKEHLSQLTPLPAGISQAALAAGRADSESPAPGDQQEEHPIPRGNVNDIVSLAFGRTDPASLQEGHDSLSTDIHLSPHTTTPPTNPLDTTPGSLNIPTGASHQMPPSSEQPFDGQDSGKTPAMTAEGRNIQKLNDSDRIPAKIDIPPINMPNASQTPVQASPSRSFTTRISESSWTPTEVPAIAMIAPTPLADRGERIPQPPRKPPPAPLDLVRPSNSSSHLHYPAKNEHSDSDYDDILEVDEVPEFERGRRKTREDDDREREIAALREKEHRSRSKKEKAKKATSEKPQDRSAEKQSQTKGPKILSLPSSPKHMVPMSPGIMQTRHLSPPDSLAAMLGQTAPLASPPMTSQRFISAPLMSPGLPRSPRPQDRPLASPTPRLPREGANIGTMASPPLSPGMGFPGLPLSPRATKAPIQHLPYTPMSVASPGLPQSNIFALSSPQPLFADQNRSTEPPPKYTEHSTSSKNSSQVSVAEGTEPSRSPTVYRGLVSEQYPGLLLPPNALPLIDVKVCSSRMRPSRASIIAGKTKPSVEDVFTLGIFARSDDKELWRVAKDMMSLPNLDTQLRQSWDFAATIPDRALFAGHAPSRIDARRDAVNEYFGSIINTPMDERTALVICQFLSTDNVDPLTDEGFRDSVIGNSSSFGPRGRPKKEGYLTKRGKNFGGWKARFFIIEDPVLKYYESPGGPHLGSIKLQNAKIGKQSQRSDHSPPGGDSEDKENEYRHAFLILEPKRKDSGSLVRHVLCAESDAERDEWVHILLQYVDCHSSEDEHPKHTLSRRESLTGKSTGLHAKQKRYGSSRREERSRDNESASRNGERSRDGLSATRNDERMKDGLGLGDSVDTLRGVSYEDTVPGGAPTHGPTPSQRQTDTPSPPTHSHKQISGPTNGARIQDAESWGNKSRTALDDPKPKKRSIWGFRGRSSSDLAVQSQQNPSSSAANLTQQPSVDRVQVRAVFGVPLAEAVEHNRPLGVDVYLPAVVYRCIEYLDAKDATSEEGIFRLSGSNVVIKGLRDRFNNEGDLNFLNESQYYDVHAVASLLKLYLRELPSTVLTRELHLDFLHVLAPEIEERSMKIIALNSLVHRLPRANWTLLKTLSTFLINVVNNSDINKMTVRNVGIVFSPTLNIPAPVFSLFLQEYDSIFGMDPDEKTPSPKELTASVNTLTPEDIRSPRRQMFSELPTPSYRQDRFSSTPEPYQRPVYDQRQLDTGFIPLRPSYEQPAYDQYSHGGSLNGAVAYNDPHSMKSRRRESSMLMVMGVNKKGSMPRLNENRDMVGDNTLYR